MSGSPRDRNLPTRFSLYANLCFPPEPLDRSAGKESRSSGSCTDNRSGTCASVTPALTVGRPLNLSPSLQLTEGMTDRGECHRCILLALQLGADDCRTNEIGPCFAEDLGDRSGVGATRWPDCTCGPSRHWRLALSTGWLLCNRRSRGLGRATATWGTSGKRRGREFADRPHSGRIAGSISLLSDDFDLLLQLDQRCSCYV